MATALATVQDYITDARVLLQDTVDSPYRYADPSLLTALNVTLLDARRLRPDLFIGQFDTLPQATAIDDTDIEIEAQFRLGILHGLVAHAFARDQEDVQDARSTLFMNVFNTILTGGAIPPLAKPRGQ